MHFVRVQVRVFERAATHLALLDLRLTVNQVALQFEWLQSSDQKGF